VHESPYTIALKPQMMVLLLRNMQFPQSDEVFLCEFSVIGGF